MHAVTCPGIQGKWLVPIEWLMLMPIVTLMSIEWLMPISDADVGRVADAHK